MEAPKLRTCRSAKNQVSYDKKLEFTRIRTHTTSGEEIFIASPFSKHASSRKTVLEETSKSKDVHHADKYYSERELNILQKKLEDTNKFVSTDQYFSKRITKMLQVEKDCSVIKQYTPGWNETDDAEKRTITQLLLRRHSQKNLKINPDLSEVKDKISQMKRDQESRIENIAARPYLKKDTTKQFMGNFSRPQTAKAT